MNVKKVVANAVAKLALKSAKTACGAASFYGPYQPKEPANLKHLLK